MQLQRPHHFQRMVLVEHLHRQTQAHTTSGALEFHLGVPAFGIKRLAAVQSSLEQRRHPEHAGHEIRDAIFEVDGEHRVLAQLRASGRIQDHGMQLTLPKHGARDTLRLGKRQRFGARFAGSLHVREQQQPHKRQKPLDFLHLRPPQGWSN
jgi:hypothetical protein